MSNDGRKPYEQGEAVLAIFKRGADFMKQLMDENESLRKQIQAVEDRQNDAAQSPGDWENLRVELLGRIRYLEDEKDSILEQLRSVENENQQFAERYLEIEEENNNLANLYVASYQLHSTLDPSEVLKVIQEIVINLIGAELFCVYASGDDPDVLLPVVAEGGPVSDYPTVRIGEGRVGESVESGEVVTAEASGLGPAEGGLPVVCIPLRVEDKAVGAIVIHRLLSQKDGFPPLDYGLLKLLAGHSANAIFA